jgi:hypothetical protein
MAEETPPEQSPDDALADLVVTKLREKGLITAEKVTEIRSKFRTGTASREDWKLWVHLAKSDKTKEHDNGKD